MREMKDSGAEWIGDIPGDWTIRPHWAVLKEKKVPVGSFHNELTLLSLTKRGVIVRDMDAGGKFPASFEGYQRVDEGDLILCLFDVEETPRTVGLSPTSGMITSAYTVMRVSGVDARFLEWYLIGMDNEKRFKPFYSGLRNVLPKPVFGSIRFAMPSAEEQRDIVSYLNQETSQIDLLISKKEQLIEKLIERRQALITQAVTKGLVPNVPMKDSGVEWIGLLPQDWKIGRLRHLVTFHNGREITKGESGEFPVYGSGGIFAWSDKVQNSAENWSVLFGRKGSIDKPLLVQGPFSCVDTMYWTTVSPEADPRFVHFVAQSLPYAAVATQTALPSMTSSALKGLRVPIPTLSNQIAIATKLENETSAIDSLIGKAQGAVQLLKERRQALITQVVTGKLDVRGFAGGNS